MKRLFFILFTLLVVAVVAYSQQIPTTVQGTRAFMRLGAHDFSADSGSVKGGSNSICGYCHSIHIPAAEALDNTPLWNRASHDATYGTYASPTMTATVTDVGADNNYSRLCLNCHDGTTALFAQNSYMPGKRPRTTTGYTWDTTATIPAEFNFGTGGEWALSHTHPVNFTYDAALVTADAPGGTGLFTPVSSSLAYSGGTGMALRLFGGKMQCSTCHNVHMHSGIGTFMSSTGGALCIACHKK